MFASSLEEMAEDHASNYDHVEHSSACEERGACEWEMCKECCKQAFKRHIRRLVAEDMIAEEKR